MIEVRGVQTQDIAIRPEDYAEIAILPNDAGEPTVYAAGKLLGPAKDVVEFILDGAASVERHRAPLSRWLEKARAALSQPDFDSVELFDPRKEDINSFAVRVASRQSL